VANGARGDFGTQNAYILIILSFLLYYICS
jgi:hypothetical protein